MQQLAILKESLEDGAKKKKRAPRQQETRDELEEELLRLTKPKFTKEQLKEILKIGRRLLKHHHQE